MTSNSVNVLTFITGASIGDRVVATSSDSSSAFVGRLVDFRLGALVLEHSDGRRLAYPHEDFTFAAAPAPQPAAFEAHEVACPGCAPKTEQVPTLEELLAQILTEIRRLGKRADARARVARKASIR